MFATNVIRTKITQIWLIGKFIFCIREKVKMGKCENAKHARLPNDFRLFILLWSGMYEIFRWKRWNRWNLIVITLFVIHRNMVSFSFTVTWNKFEKLMLTVRKTNSYIFLDLKTKNIYRKNILQYQMFKISVQDFLKNINYLWNITKNSSILNCILL